MFRPRRFSEVPAKRSGPLLLGRASPQLHNKRQKLHLPSPTQSDDNGQGHLPLVAQTDDWMVRQMATLPTAIQQDLARHKPRAVRIFSCKVHGSRQLENESFWLLLTKSKVLLWRDQASAKVLTITISHPSSIVWDLEEEQVFPFLCALYDQSLSLLVITQSGSVLFWGDVELPYESVPLTVQIPLGGNETIASSPFSVVSSDRTNRFQSILCWSNQGGFWDVSLDDCRLRVRSFEKKRAGFLAGLTSSVSSLFFSRGSTDQIEFASGAQSIECIRRVPQSRSSNNNSNELTDVLVLFSNGFVERRSISMESIDCSCSTKWQFDVRQCAVAFFQENFRELVLVQCDVLALPCVGENTFSALVAWVSTSSSSSSSSPTGDMHSIVKFMIFQFSSSASNDSPEYESSLLLPFDPQVSNETQLDQLFQVESYNVTKDAFYLVWQHVTPVHVMAILTSDDVDGAAKAAVSLNMDWMTEDERAVAFVAKSDASSSQPDCVNGLLNCLVLRRDRGNDTDDAVNGGVYVAFPCNMENLPAEVQDELEEEIMEPSSTGTGWNVVHLDDHSIDYLGTLKKLFAENAELQCNVNSPQVLDNFTRAALAFDLQMMDAKPTSGLLWEKHRARELSRQEEAEVVTPKLTRLQLEEKLRRHLDFMDFLEHQCKHVWRYVKHSKGFLSEFAEHEEQLHAAIALCRFQASLADTSRSGGRLLLQAIEQTVQFRGYKKEQLRLAGFSAFDIFYYEVSRVAEVFRFLSLEVKQQTLSTEDDYAMYALGLLESNNCMIQMLNASDNIRKHKQTADRYDLDEAVPSRWLYHDELREILMDQVARTSRLIGYDSVREMPLGDPFGVDYVFDFVHQIQRLGRALMACVSSADASTNGDAYVNAAKRCFLGPLIYVATFSRRRSENELMENLKQKQHELFDTCVELCEAFLFFDGMVHLLLVEEERNLNNLDFLLGRDAHSSAKRRMEKYCHQFEEFKGILFCWLAGDVKNPWQEDQSRVRRHVATLLSMSHLFDDSLHRFFQEHSSLSKHCWMTAASMGRYETASMLAFHEAVKETKSCARRETMGSIAKIAAFAASVDSRREQDIVQINREVLRTKVQNALVALLSENVSMDQRPLSSQKLVDSCLNSLRKTTDESSREPLFILALEALDSLQSDPSEHGGASEFDGLRLRIWREGILMDQELWRKMQKEYAAGSNEGKLEEMMRNTLLFAGSEFVARQQSRARLTTEVMDELVQEDNSAEAVLSARSRQLFAKTIHLAQPK